MMKRNLLVFALCACATGAQAEVYKWIDADGKTQYGDAPPKNVKAKVVSGGVTVVPALITPPAPATGSKAAGDAGGEGGQKEGNVSKSDGSPAPASTAPDPALAARAEARMKAIERCKKNRGVDCENEVDAELNGEPGLGYVQGWSQPPIRPVHRPAPPIARPKPLPPAAQASAPVAQMSKRHQSQSSVSIKPML